MFKLLDELKNYKPYDNKEQEDLTKIVIMHIKIVSIKFIKFYQNC